MRPAISTDVTSTGNANSTSWADAEHMPQANAALKCHHQHLLIVSGKTIFQESKCQLIQVNMVVSRTVKKRFQVLYFDSVLHRLTHTI